MKVYNPSLEERAFLYQEAQDIEPLVKDLGSLTVLVEEITVKRPKTKTPFKRNYRVTFMVAPESVGMRVRATDSNLFDATIAAKEETLRQLNAIVNSMPRQWSMDPKDMKIPPELLH